MEAVQQKPGEIELDNSIESLQKDAKPDTKIYQTIRLINSIHSIVILFFSLLLGGGVFIFILGEFHVSTFEGLASLVIVGGITLILWSVALYVYNLVIRSPIDQALYLSIKKKLVQNLPKQFELGSEHFWKMPPGMLAVDYKNRVIAYSIYDYKYKPKYLSSDNINSVNVSNNCEVTSITEFSSSSKKGITKSKSKDNYYLEIHYQLPLEVPSWIRIPFGKNGTEAKSIASAILKM